MLCFHFKGQPGNPGVGSGQLVHLGNAVFKILSLTLAVRSVKMSRTLSECIYFVALAPLMVTIRERGKFSKRGQEEMLFPTTIFVSFKYFKTQKQQECLSKVRSGKYMYLCVNVQSITKKLS